MLACVLPLVAVAVGFSGHVQTGDYGNPICHDWHCDDPAPALHRLAQGHVSGFFAAQPAMGLVSLALRAPAVAIAHAGNADIVGEYQAGSAICLAAAVLTVVWVAHLAHRRGAPLVAVLAALALWMVAILWTRAPFFGHPEEPLAGALAIAALAAAADERPVLAGTLLGLAIGTKEWALLVAPAVFLVARAEQWRRIALPAVVTVAVAIGVMAAGNPHSFHEAHAQQQRGDLRTLSPASAWYRLGHTVVVARQGNLVQYKAFPPELIGRWCRPFVILLALLVSLVYWRRRGFGKLAAFALAAFVLDGRAILDTQTFSYHLVPMVMAVAAWEVFARRRLPVAAALAMGALQLSTRVLFTDADISSWTFNTIFLSWTTVLAAYLLFVAMRREPARAGSPQAPLRSATPC